MDDLVRDARVGDIDSIFSLARDASAFQVSARIPFYERVELVQWIESPEQNILCVVGDGGAIAGFFFCKIMSCHWAMLDNFYAASGPRRAEFGHAMFEGLLKRLRERGISYLTTLVSAERLSLNRLLRRQGFRPSKTYTWNEYFLD